MGIREFYDDSGRKPADGPARPATAQEKLDRLESELAYITREQKTGAFGLYGKKLAADRKRLEAEAQPLRTAAYQERVAAAAQARREEEERNRVTALNPAQFRRAAIGEAPLAPVDPDVVAPTRVGGLSIGKIVKRAP